MGLRAWKPASGKSQAGEALQVALAEVPHIRQGMLGRGKQVQRGLEQVKNPPVGIIGGGKIRLIAAHPGIEHPLPHQLQGPLQTGQVETSADPALRSGAQKPGARGEVGIDPQGPIAAQPRLLMHHPFGLQQFLITLELKATTAANRIETQQPEHAALLAPDRALVHAQQLSCARATAHPENQIEGS
jgi:hypothetical protein